METLIKNMEAAKTIDFVPEEYYDYVKPIITMLKSGRASDYKEALNMAIEEDRQAQAEAARREEEARRTRIMEEQAAAELRRAEEMERHNRQMELEQQHQNKMMLEEQRKQAEAQRPKTGSSHPFSWRNDKVYVPGVGYRDNNGNYYNHNGTPIPPPVTINNKK